MEDFQIVVHVEGVQHCSCFDHILPVSLVEAPLQLCCGFYSFFGEYL